jgi:hypothetical protein
MRTAHPNVGVIVLSNYADRRYAAGLLDGGTLGRGCLLKGHAGLRLIRSGKRYSEVGLKFRLAMEGKSMMGLIPSFHELKETTDEAFELLRRAVAALEKLAAEQKRANDLYAEVNQVSRAQARNATEL